MSRHCALHSKIIGILVLLLSMIGQSVAISASPRDEILFIFNHGSNAKLRLGFDCYYPLVKPRPQWLNDIDGQVVDDRKIRVITPCTGYEAGGLPDEYGCNESWVCNRAVRISEVIEKFRERGYPAQNIFVGGQSAGGWASLLIKRWKPNLFNGVIATAPAFNGKRRGRFCANALCNGEFDDKANMWNSDYRYQHEKRLGLMGASRPDLRALVFTFPCDPYARPAELLFKHNNSVEMRIYPTEIGKPLSCAKPKQRLRYLTETKQINVDRCDEPKKDITQSGPVCGSGKRGDPTLAMILNCSPNLKGKCERNQHTKTHRSDDFREFIASSRAVLDFIEYHVTHWTPSSISSSERSPCSFLKIPDWCPSYEY